MLTPTDLLEIECKARAYQAEEAANPDAKTCHRPTPELVLRLVEEMRKQTASRDTQYLERCKAEAERDQWRQKAEWQISTLGVQSEKIDYLHKERDELRAKVSNLEKDCDCLGKERIEWQRKNGMLEAKVAELEAYAERCLRNAADESHDRVKELKALVARIEEGK